VWCASRHTDDLISLIKDKGFSPHPTTLRCTILVNPSKSTHSRRSSLSASVLSPTGCGLTGCSLIQTKPRYSGEQQVDTSIHFQTLHCRSTASRSLLSGTSVRNQNIDSDLGMRAHGQRTVSGCSAALRQLRQIHNSVPTATFQLLVDALVLSRLDYRNSVLISLLIHLLCRLQSVQNAASWVTCRLQRFDHVTGALVSLHWLCIPERVVYKIAVLKFKVLHGIAPEYLKLVVRVAEMPGRQSLRSAALTTWWCHLLKCQQLALKLSQWPVLASGIVCRQTLHWHHRCRPSAND